MSPDDIPEDISRVLGKGHGVRINKMVSSLIDASYDKPYIIMPDDVKKATDDLRHFLFEHVYLNPLAKGEEIKAKELLFKLFEYYVKNPDKMPEMYRRNIESESVERCVCDFVSGMTDRYAIEMYNDIFVPKVWRGR
jgi:dGTPase